MDAFQEASPITGATWFYEHLQTHPEVLERTQDMLESPKKHVREFAKKVLDTYLAWANTNCHRPIRALRTSPEYACCDGTGMVQVWELHDLRDKSVRRVSKAQYEDLRGKVDELNQAVCEAVAWCHCPFGQRRKGDRGMER